MRTTSATPASARVARWATVGSEAEGKQDCERRHQPEGIRVANQLVQLVAAQGIVGPADVTGEELGTEGVDRYQHGSRDDTAEKRGRSLAGGQQQERGCSGGHVEDPALRLEHGCCCAGRPERGERCPPRERPSRRGT